MSCFSFSVSVTTMHFQFETMIGNTKNYYVKNKRVKAKKSGIIATLSTIPQQTNLQARYLYDVCFNM